MSDIEKAAQQLGESLARFLGQITDDLERDRVAASTLIALLDNDLEKAQKDLDKITDVKMMNEILDAARKLKDLTYYRTHQL